MSQQEYEVRLEKNIAKNWIQNITYYIKLMRPKHYLKNGLIILPLFFSGKIFLVQNIKNIMLGFLAFSLISSVVYIINDIRDIEKDRRHPLKKNRPIASGRVSIRGAVSLAIILFILAMGLNYYVETELRYVASLILLIYMMMNIAYSIKLKDIPIIDVTILAVGFLLRIVYGSALTNIQVSKWMYLTVITFSFYMGLGKRRNELEKSESGETREVLKSYTYNFLDKNMYMCLAIGLVFYSLWTVNIETVRQQGNNDILMWTVPVVLVICMRYNLIIERDSYGDPVDVILSDKVLILLGIVYALITFLLIYGYLPL